MSAKSHEPRLKRCRFCCGQLKEEGPVVVHRTFDLVGFTLEAEYDKVYTNAFKCIKCG